MSSSNTIVLKETNVPTESSNTVQVPLKKWAFFTVIGCLSLAMFLIVLDTAIIPPAIPNLVKEFGNVGQIGWIGSAYLLAATAFSPLFGSFADIFGRKISFLMGVLLFATGGLISGFSTSMSVMIVGRIISGAGRSGIFATTLIIIADIATLRDRGLYQGIVGGFYGLASVFGPMIGGGFVDRVSWRWCFWISPVLAAPIFIWSGLIHYPAPEGDLVMKLKKLDYAGVVVLLAAVSCFLIPVQAGGTIWKWDDVQTIVLFVLSPILLGLLVFIESRVSNPILPADMLENKSVTLLLVIAFIFGTGFFPINYYINSFFVVVKGTTAFDSGLLAIPLMAGSILFNVISGLMITLFGRYKYWLLVGPCILLTGQALLCSMNERIVDWAPSLYLGIAGIGLGCIVQVRIIALQASVSQKNIAIATAMSNFCMNLGGCIGIAISSAILTNRLYQLLPGTLAEVFIKSAPKVRVNPEASRIIPAVADAISKTYYYSMPLSVVLFVLAYFVVEYRIEKPSESNSKA